MSDLELIKTPTSDLISVIVRTVDRPFYLRECLASIIFQDYPNIEIVLINDGGPSIKEILAELPQHRNIRLVELDTPVGRSASANIGLDEARGEYLAFLDDDDIYYPFHLSTLREAANIQNSSVVYSDAVCAKQIPCEFDPRNYITTELELIYSKDGSLEDLYEVNFIPILCVLFHRRCLASGTRFDTKLEVYEDWDFWIRLRQEFSFLHLPQITSEYRLRTDGTNTVGQHLDRWRASRNYLLKKHEKIKGPQEGFYVEAR